VLVLSLSACAGSPGEERIVASQARSETADDAGRARRDRDAGSSDAPPDASAWQPLGANESFAGRSLQEWAVEWARFAVSQTSCDSGDFDPDGSFCGLYQDPEAPLFFFNIGETGTERTRCVVPAGKAILVPVLSMAGDNGGVPAEEQLTDTELEELIADVHASGRDLSLWVDRVEVTGLERWSVGPSEFSYIVPPEPNYYSCNGYEDVHGTIAPAYVAGYFVLLPPPPVGTHTLEYGGTQTLYETDFVNDVTTTFTVE